MGTNSDIEWTDWTLQITRGCSRVSRECINCYAEKMAWRFGAKPGQPYFGLVVKTPTGPTWNGKLALVESAIDEPLSWKTPRRIFVNSMSDIFHENIPFEFIDKFFRMMGKCHDAKLGHTFQLLTKRPERMHEYMMTRAYQAWHGGAWEQSPAVFPPPNVHLGVSAGTQEAWDERIEILGRTPAAVRFVSGEPVLERIDTGNAFDVFPEGDYKRPDWVIVGGESGHGARQCNPDWLRSIVRDALNAGVAVFVKQLGANIVTDGIQRPGQWWPDQSPMEQIAGATLFRKRLKDAKGGDWTEWPEDLRIRQFPELKVAA